VREFDGEDDGFFEGFFGLEESGDVVPADVRGFGEDGAWKREGEVGSGGRSGGKGKMEEKGEKEVRREKKKGGRRNALDNPSLSFFVSASSSSADPFLWGEGRTGGAR
jgi:hypothetical protein